MAKTRLCEAIWTINAGPLERQAQAAALFAAVGQVVDVEPARYDLNRRGQWRPYSGPALMVDVLTQRTQLVTIVEKRGLDEGGVEVVLATGKHGEPPQAIARWHQRWPPTPEVLQRWEKAAVEAFDDLELRSFVLRVVDGDEDGEAVGSARIVAACGTSRYEELKATVAGPGKAFGRGGVRGWSSVQIEDD